MRKRNKGLYKPSYLKINDSDFEAAIANGKRMLSSCRLCPRQCSVDRIGGHRGFCGCSSNASVSSWLLHKGEEPVLIGRNGAGTVFFGGCTLSCVFCQNWQISSKKTSGAFSSEKSAEELGRIFLDLQDHGAANIDLVTPTMHIPSIIEALFWAKRNGLSLPVAYNTNSYMSREAFGLISPFVDIWLADLKYYSEANALKYSSAARYNAIAFESIRDMYEKRPLLVTDNEGRALKGCIVRILLLPDGSDEAEKSLLKLAEHGILPSVSIMGQFSPLYRAGEFPELLTKTSAERIDYLASLADSLGFENVWFQYDDASEIFSPDFSKDNPFGQANPPL